jgi:ketosteroid isomerase-like protein
MNLADIVQRGWEAVGAGDFDSLVSDYVEDMKFIMPGQGDVLEGRQAFRKALDSLGEILLFKFEGDKIYEERWFLDTDQWKSAF